MARAVVVPEVLALLTMSVSLVFAFVIVWARECP
jgi:hypothetical protein